MYDTGSDPTVMNYGCFVDIGSPKLSSGDISLGGIRKEIVTPMGHFSYEIYVGIPLFQQIFMCYDHLRMI